MKNLKICIVAMVAYGCEKEVAAPEATPAKEMNSNNVKAVLDKGFAKVNALSDSEYYNAMLTMKEAMYVNKGLANKTQLEVDSIPLEDIFFHHEGIINSIYTSQGKPMDELGIEEILFEVPVFTDEEENFYIEIEDYETFYGQIVDAIEQEVEVNNNEYLSLGDLQLLDVTSNSATISIALVIGTVPPATPAGPFLHPGGSVHGAAQAGPCATNNPGVDAADFFRGYVNGTGLLANTACPTGTNKFMNVVLLYYSYNPNDYINLQVINPGTELLPYIWKDNTNSCVGDDTYSWNNSDIWHLWYARMDYLADLPIANYLQSVDPSAEFLTSNYHSHINGPGSYWGFGSPSYQYYHGGMFAYGQVYCH